MKNIICNQNGNCFLVDGDLWIIGISLIALFSISTAVVTVLFNWLVV